jgi:glycosyltransferase involved in cell wall biosynthesis
MRFVADNRAEAAAIAKRGQDEVSARFNLKVVGKMWADFLSGFAARVGGVAADREQNSVGTGLDSVRASYPRVVTAHDTGDSGLVDTTRTETSPVPGAVASKRRAKGSKRIAATKQLAPSPSPLVSQSSVLPVSPSSALSLLRVRIIGEFFVWHSLGLCNREFARRFVVDPDLNVSIVPIDAPEFGPEFDPGLQLLVDRANALLPDYAHFEIRHHYPPRLNKPTDPRTKLILIAPWEYYRLPTDWIQPILANVTEVWAYSETVKQCYIDSGVPESMVKVIPLGVDTRIFRPDAPPYQFTDEPGAHRLAGFEQPPTVFLAMGTIERKGLDTLLEAYCNTFSFYDNVLLVIKDTGVNTVYRGGTQGDRLRELANSPTGPAIIYIERELPPAEHAGLFTAAHLVALPYYNEGFCLPALEAQASGRPPCVPAGGPTADFCDSSNSIIVPATLESMGTNRIGDWVCCGDCSRLAINPRGLGRAMRWAHEHPEETRAVGVAGAQQAREKYTWDHTVARMKERLVELADSGKEWESGREGEGEIKGRGNPPPCIRYAAGEGTREEGRDDAGDGETREDAPNAERRTPELKLVSGVEIRDRRSVNALTPNAPRQTPNIIGFPAILRRAPEIGVVMIVKDEAGCIDECLTSLRPHFKHIYVVDTGSSDNTVEICLSHGCVVEQRPWPFSFSVARNWSLELAAKGDCDFLFWTDADDVLPGESGEGMLRLVAMAEDRVAGYIMQVHIPPGRGEEGMTIVDHLKVFRAKDKRTGEHDYKFEGRVHEQLLQSINRAGGIVQRTSLYTVHRNYNRSVAGQQKKRERDEYLLRLDEEEQPDASFPRFNTGMSSFHWHEYDRAIEKFHECIERASPRESIMRSVYAMLSGCYVAKRDFENARKAIDTGLGLTPRDPELLFRAGNLAREMADLKAAERFYLKLLNERETGFIQSADASIATFKGHHNAASNYVDMGSLQEAEAHFRAALGYHPGFAPSWAGLGELFIRQRRFDDALDVAAKLDSISPPLAQALRRNLAAAQNTRAI